MSLGASRRRLALVGLAMLVTAGVLLFLNRPDTEREWYEEFWGLPTPVADAVVRGGRQLSSTLTTPRAVATYLLDRLIPVEERKTLGVGENVTKFVKLAYVDFGKDDRLLSMQAASGEHHAEGVDLDIAEPDSVGTRAVSSIWRRVEEGMLLVKEDRGRNNGRRSDAAIIAYSARGSIECWVVGEHFLLKIVPRERPDPAGLEAMFAALLRVRQRSLELADFFQECAAAEPRPATGAEEHADRRAFWSRPVLNFSVLLLAVVAVTLLVEGAFRSASKPQPAVETVEGGRHLAVIGCAVLTGVAASLVSVAPVYPLLVALPLLYELPLWFVAFAFGLASWLLTFDLGRAESSGRVRLRLPILLMPAMALSVIYFCLSWGYGISYQGFIPLLVMVSINAGIIGFLWCFWWRWRRSLTPTRALVLATVLNVWLVSCAFPWLGEMP